MEWEFVLAAFFRLLLAAVFGGVVGWEREFHEKGAGLRTHMLICVAACLFALVTAELRKTFPDAQVMRVVQGLLIGIGFLGGGVIFTRGGSVHGLTTAAGLWALTGVGLTVGFGYYFLGALGTAFAFIIIATLKSADVWLRAKFASQRRSGDGEQTSDDS
ncbi:MAG: MgtC/SapB family protein [Planctomycetota bacterium]